MEFPHYQVWLPCIHVDHGRGTALVKSFRNGRSYPVVLSKDIRYLVNQGDSLYIIKSHVTGELTAIDYNAMIGGDLQ